VRLAEEGADVIAFDVAGPVEAQGAPAATPEDLAETVRLVEKLDRRIVSAHADVRDAAAVAEVVERGVAELGGLDVVVPTPGSRATRARPRRPPPPTGGRSSTPISAASSTQSSPRSRT
jgi:NAD(P)-dependent dehydrogenase (short-subunit alcohol dehydrogenase family)